MLVATHMIQAKLEAIASHLPQRIVSNDELSRDHPEWDMKLVEARAGVRERRFAAEDETAVDLAEKACRRLFQSHPEAEEADTLVFCTQTPDYFLPANACVLHQKLELPLEVFAFDLAMGCSGYVNGLALARSLIVSGQSRSLLLVTADTLSKRTGPDDRSVRVLFGDGAAVTWISAGEEGESGILDVECATEGKFFDRIIIPGGGCRRPAPFEATPEESDGPDEKRTPEQVFMDGIAVLGLVSSKVPPQIRSLLERNGLSLDDVDLFAFHQASKLALDALQSRLKLPKAKVVRNLDRVGNTVSASIPLVLEEALNGDRLKPGDLVLASGFGVGLTWASALIRF
ncbi:MAG TPA: ketoacyl-ACP synthase III [Acidobacteriota bacterium]|nr:ketoacyl-ACP synthase III [Acidobacteriota bacterium]